METPRCPAGLNFSGKRRNDRLNKSRNHTATEDTWLGPREKCVDQRWKNRCRYVSKMGGKMDGKYWHLHQKTKNKQETCFSEAQRYPYGNVAKDPRLTQGTLEFKRWRKSWKMVESSIILRQSSYFWIIFPLKPPFSSGISQLATFHDTRG